MTGKELINQIRTPKSGIKLLKNGIIDTNRMVKDEVNKEMILYNLKILEKLCETIQRKMK